MLTFDMSYPAVLSGRVESAALDQANIFDMRVMRGLMPIAVPLRCECLATGCVTADIWLGVGFDIHAGRHSESGTVVDRRAKPDRVRRLVLTEGHICVKNVSHIRRSGTFRVRTGSGLRRAQFREVPWQILPVRNGWS